MIFTMDSCLPIIIVELLMLQAPKKEELTKAEFLVYQTTEVACSEMIP